jgi:8-oxo-dGTP pyrophosphatase MutT (NUDIX family)
VLMPFFRQGGEWHLLFTERTNSVEQHKGQVAFPGGRADDGDASRVETALREAEEEIGLRRGDVTVLGALDELLTVTQYRVTPILGTFDWPYHFRTSPAEIADVFHVPLAWLTDPANVEIQPRQPPAGGPPIPIYYFRYQGHTIWGVTARIVINFLDVTGLRR